MESSQKYQKLLVIAAMQVEEEEIARVLGSFETVVLSDKLSLYGKSFKKEDKEILLIQSGIGQVNVAIATMLAIEKYPRDGIFLLGVAGALRDHLEIGDAIVADTIVQHDSVFSSESGTEFMAPGYPYVSQKEAKREDHRFYADAALKQHILDAMSKNRIPFHAGTILSGSEFVGQRRRKDALAQLDEQALAVEMEAAGIALVAKKMQIPFVVVKTIADRLNPDGSIASDYRKFVGQASVNAAVIARTLWDL